MLPIHAQSLAAGQQAIDQAKLQVAELGSHLGQSGVVGVLLHQPRDEENVATSGGQN